VAEYYQITFNIKPTFTKRRKVMKNKKHNFFRFRASMFVLSVCLLAFVMTTLAQDSEIITASGAGLALFNGDYRYEGDDNQGLPTFMKVGSFYRISYRSYGSTPGWRLYSTRSGRTYYYAPIPGLALPPQDGWISVYGYAAPAFTLSGDLTSSGNEPPMADAGEDQTFDCVSESGVSVTLDGSGSSDPDDDPLTYSWSVGASGVSPTVTLGPGTHTITLTVDDGTDTDTDGVVITVNADTDPPDISIANDQLGMWPPNHKYKTFTINDFGVSVDDNCGCCIEAKIISVSSSEPDDAKGGGDGNTTRDCYVVDDQTVKLRAERQGGGDGRVYTITLSASDGAGNTSEATCEVIVPHDRSGLPKGIGGFITDSEMALPEDYFLSQNYPNPFNPSTTISFGLPQAENVTLNIYNAAGQLIRTLTNTMYSAGSHNVTWDATDYSGVRVANGIYIYELRANNFVQQRKMLLMK